MRKTRERRGGREGRELFAELTVLENLRLGPWPHRRDRASETGRVEEVMDLFPRLRERSGQPADPPSSSSNSFVHLALKHTSRAYVRARGQVVLEGMSDELAASPELMSAYLGEIGAPAASTGVVMSTA
jgi:ABC-type branched-subunit amino acid transport system ATPase component